MYLIPLKFEFYLILCTFVNYKQSRVAQSQSNSHWIGIIYFTSIASMVLMALTVFHGGSVRCRSPNTINNDMERTERQTRVHVENDPLETELQFYVGWISTYSLVWYLVSILLCCVFHSRMVWISPFWSRYFWYFSKTTKNEKKYVNKWAWCASQRFVPLHRNKTIDK